MEWHPNTRVLAVGFKNGTISLYSDDTGKFIYIIFNYITFKMINI